MSTYKYSSSFKLNQLQCQRIRRYNHREHRKIIRMKYKNILDYSSKHKEYRWELDGYSNKLFTSDRMTLKLFIYQNHSPNPNLNITVQNIKRPIRKLFPKATIEEFYLAN